MNITGVSGIPKMGEGVCKKKTFFFGLNKFSCSLKNSALQCRTD